MKTLLLISPFAHTTELWRLDSTSRAHIWDFPVQLDLKISVQVHDDPRGFRLVLG